jgi:hypothetical protein
MNPDDGKVSPLLEPVHKRGAPKNSVGMEGAKATAVFAVERLRAAGKDVNEADERVALGCRKAGFRPGRKGAENQIAEMTDRTVRGWREDIAEDVGCRSRARTNRRNAVPSSSGQSPGAVAALSRQYKPT